MTADGAGVAGPGWYDAGHAGAGPSVRRATPRTSPRPTSTAPGAPTRTPRWHARRSRRISHLRLLAAALAAIGFVLIATNRGGLPAALLAGFGPGLFVALAIHHAGVERRRERAAGHAVLNREALARLERRWDALPPAWEPGPLDDHPYAADLDVFGHASIAQLAGPVHTPTGRRALASWLLSIDQATLAGVRERQAAVAELAPALDFRQDLTLAARATPHDAGAARARRVRRLGRGRQLAAGAAVDPDPRGGARPRHHGRRAALLRRVDRRPLVR